MGLTDSYITHRVNVNKYFVFDFLNINQEPERYFSSYKSNFYSFLLPVSLNAE